MASIVAVGADLVRAVHDMMSLLPAVAAGAVDLLLAFLL